jgi:hypothetical protein
MITVHRAVWLMHDEHVDRVLGRRVHDRHRRVVVDDDVGMPALAGHLCRVGLERVRRAARLRRLGRAKLGVGGAARKDHLYDVQLGLEAIRERRRPPHRALGRLRPVGSDHHAMDRTTHRELAVWVHSRIMPATGLR